MYKLCFFVPESHLELVKDALFKQGAGTIGDYACCSWQVLGEGQFKPLQGSQPFLGNIGEITRIAEYKVEMVCTEKRIKSVLSALLLAHPYQEPAYEVYKILTADDFSHLH
ncbi:MAG: YqfO family protein [Methyloprofundus sp.]|nr:YqfO family protein [Methyloprofundus sp.]MDT8426207.1 YqfO family protein [Methyloprofundus sp.]